MARRAKSAGKWIERILRTDPPRSKSLIVTVFGDSIAPHASGLWLSELIQLMEPFGVNERLVRTSSFRLVEEGWLRTERQGRRSRYALTASGEQRVSHASQRIYKAPPSHWDGSWTVAILRKAANGAAERLQLRKELEWEGFGPLAPGIFVRPSGDSDAISEVLDRLGLSASVVLLRAADLSSISACPSSTLAMDCWRLDLVASRYEEFVQRFQPVVALLECELEPRVAFVVQTLLVHEFRRVVLHDPRLPGPLMPPNWPGKSAYGLCHTIYSRTFDLSRQFVTQNMEEIREGKAKPDRKVLSRFGGIERSGIHDDS